MKRLFLFLLSPILLISAPKALHLTFHKGTEMEMEYLCKHFGIELTTWNILANPSFTLKNKNRTLNYIVTHEMAKQTFQTYKEEFEKYDLIIISDIAPLSRIFLQNNWKGPLLIWVCNRFDMNAFSSGQKKFPDREYLQLFDRAKDLPNVEVIGYCNYEAYHAKKRRGIDTIKTTIEPTGNGEAAQGYRCVSTRIDKKSAVFLRNYHNERKLRLKKRLHQLGIAAYQGPFRGGEDLKDFIGVVHVPLVMGNLLLWENLRHGIVHFIPSKKLYKEWYEQRKIDFWDWSSPYRKMSKIDIDEIFSYCDWYNPKLAPLFVFFDAIEEIPDLIKETDFTEKRALIQEFHKQHTKECLEKWQPIFEKLLL